MPAPDFALELNTTNGGTFNFVTQCETPLIERSVTNMRLSDQGPAHRMISVVLTGFFIGERHSDIVTQYQRLIALLADSSATMYYSDGANIIINQKRVYIDGYNEPKDWKQYDGYYQINLHYFEPNTPNTDLGIICSYQSSIGTFTFAPTPLWSRQQTPTRGNLNQNRLSYAGRQIASEGQITLHGFFQSTYGDASEIATKILNLSNCLKRDGTLTYGSFTFPVYAGQLSVPDVFPRDYCEYTVTFRYFTDQLYSLSAKRRFSRLHCNPKIRELPYCSRRTVQLFNYPGQTVQYDLKATAPTLVLARSLLATEVNAMLVGTSSNASGIELPGGTETWDDDEISVSVSFQRYHAEWILANIEGNPRCQTIYVQNAIYTGEDGQDPSQVMNPQTGLPSRT